METKKRPFTASLEEFKDRLNWAMRPVQIKDTEEWCAIETLVFAAYLWLAKDTTERKVEVTYDALLDAVQLMHRDYVHLTIEKYGKALFAVGNLFEGEIVR